MNCYVDHAVSTSIDTVHVHDCAFRTRERQEKGGRA